MNTKTPQYDLETSIHCHWIVADAPFTKVRVKVNKGYVVQVTCPLKSGDNCTSKIRFRDRCYLLP